MSVTKFGGRPLQDPLPKIGSKRIEVPTKYLVLKKEFDLVKFRKRERESGCECVCACVNVGLDRNLPNGQRGTTSTLKYFPYLIQFVTKGLMYIRISLVWI